MTVEADEGADYLLTVEDLAEAGFAGVEAQDINDVPMFENPDPRGICGGVVPVPPLDGAVGRAFTSATSLVVEMVVPLTPEVEVYFASLEAEADSDVCSSYESTTNQGLEQVVHEIVVLDTEAIDGEALAHTATITVAGQVNHVGAVIVLSDLHVMFLQVGGAQTVSGEQLLVLGAAAAERLPS